MMSDLVTLSVEIEADGGWDSIPTIDRMYRWPDEDSACRCVMPGCEFRRHDPVEMWKHVHVSGHNPVPSVVAVLEAAKEEES
jgi:hypothetical protein